MNPETIELTEFPALPEPISCCCQISKYLDPLLKSHLKQEESTVKIPALLELAKFFGTNHLNVYDAFQHLRRQGYDYQIFKLDDGIVFWYKSEK